MSDKKAAAPAPAEAAAPKSKKNVLLIVVIIALVLVIVIGGALAAWLVMSSSSGSAEPVAEEESHGEAKKEKKKKKEKGEHAAVPTFEKLETFTVNLAGDGNVLLQTEIFVELEDEHGKDMIKNYMPKIRSDVILHLSGKRPEEITSAEGKLKLQAELKEQINKVLGAKSDDEGVKGVSFSSFIVQ